MRIAIANDHAGYPLKDEIINTLQELGHEVIDLGAFNQEPVDYPDFAEKAAKTILKGQSDRGIIICGSGVGACIAANKIKGIYGGVCRYLFSSPGS
jgi:ribose 5-phosphate isomerase B